MDFSTSSYQTETPRCLWEPWTKGPGDEHERYSDRIQALIAFDLLIHAPERLSAKEERFAERIIEEAGLNGI